jgi:putative tricarboxylic transport membrane protein
MIRTADIVTASVLMLVGAIVLSDALRLGIGWGSDGPKSGFFPFWLAMLMLAACVGIVLQALRRPKRAPFVTREQLAPVLKVLWPATAMVVLMQFVGMYVASAVYIGFYMRWIGRHSWPAVIGLGVGIPIITFLIFEKWFLVPMPKGPLETWLGY